MVFEKITGLTAAFLCCLLPMASSASAGKADAGRQQRPAATVAIKAAPSVSVSKSATNSPTEKDRFSCPQGNRNPSGTVLKKAEDVRRGLKDKRVKGSGTRSLNPDFLLPKGYQEITIMGKAVATQNQAAQLIASHNPALDIGCSVGEIVALYWEEAEREGVRPDMALAQALVETGYFRFGGDVEPWQHNFCGLGTTGGGVKGAAFKTPRDGVRAHIQHLLAYSSHARPKTALLDPRYEGARRLRLQNGLITKWSGLNWTWAMGGEYAEKIVTTRQKMLQCKDEAPRDMWKDFSIREKQMEAIYEKKKRYEAKKERLTAKQMLKKSLRKDGKNA